MESAGRILKVVEDEGGVATWSDLIAAGITRSEIRSAVGRKLLRRVRKRIYVLSAATLTWEQKVRIAVRAAEPHGTVAGLSAAALLRFDGFSHGAVQIVVPPTVDLKVEDATIIRSRDFDPKADRRYVDGLPVTKIPRTLLDLVSLCTQRQLIIAVEGLLRDLSGVMRGAVTYLRERAKGRPGVIWLADSISERLYRRPTDNQWEVVAELLVREAGLPPSRQLEIWRKDGSFVAKPDLVYRAHMLVVEVDGNQTHGRPSTKADDRRREARLRAEGYEIVRTTPTELKNDPQGFIARLRARLAERPVKGVPPMSPNPEQLLLLVDGRSTRMPADLCVPTRVGGAHWSCASPRALSDPADAQLSLLLPVELRHVANIRRVDLVRGDRPHDV